MVTTRSQDRTPQGSALVPSTNISEGSPSSRRKRANGKPALFAAAAGKRRRLSPPEPIETGDEVAVLSSQVGHESRAARALALRPHESSDELNTPVQNGEEHEMQDAGPTGGEGTQMVEETQIADMEGAIESASSDADEETLLPTFDSSQAAAINGHENDQQVMESTQDLDLQNLTTSESNTQPTTSELEPLPPHQMIGGDSFSTSREDTSKMDKSNHRNQRNGSRRQSPNGTKSTGQEKHFRFTSEEPNATPVTAPPAVNGHKAEAAPEESDDDAAPEAVTASAGQDQARLIATEAARATKRALQDEKDQRRKRDAKLKEQAKGSKRQSKHTAKVGRQTEDPSIAAAEDLARSLLELDKLPDVLPEEIFEAHAAMAAQPMSIQIQPPQAVSRKRKFIDVREKPPKDVVRGSRRVRTLRDERTTLPPKTSARSKHVREQWLAGYRGDGLVAAQRRRPRHPLLVK